MKAGLADYQNEVVQAIEPILEEDRQITALLERMWAAHSDTLASSQNCTEKSPKRSAQFSSILVVRDVNPRILRRKYLVTIPEKGFARRTAPFRNHALKMVRGKLHERGYTASDLRLAKRSSDTWVFEPSLKGDRFHSAKLETSREQFDDLPNASFEAVAVVSRKRTASSAYFNQYGNQVATESGFRSTVCIYAYPDLRLIAGAKLETEAPNSITVGESSVVLGVSPHQQAHLIAERSYIRSFLSTALTDANDANQWTSLTLVRNFMIGIEKKYDSQPPWDGLTPRYRLFWSDEILQE